MFTPPIPTDPSHPRTVADAEMSHKWAQVVRRHKQSQEAQSHILPIPIKPSNLTTTTTTTTATATATLPSQSHKFHLTDPPSSPTHHTPPPRPRTKQIPNYPPSTTPLPPNLDNTDIIEGYPNHLHGQLLLEIVQTWTAKEINRRMISGRVKFARRRFEEGYKPRAYARVGKVGKEGDGGEKKKRKKMGKVEALGALLEGEEGGDGSGEGDGFGGWMGNGAGGKE